MTTPTLTGRPTPDTVSPDHPLNPDGKLLQQLEADGLRRITVALRRYAERIFEGITPATVFLLPQRAVIEDVLRPLREELLKWIEEVALAGVEFGIEQVEVAAFGVKPQKIFETLGADFGPLSEEPGGLVTDWTLANSDATEWAGAYTGRLVQGISNKTQYSLGSDVIWFAESGATMPELVRRVQNSYTFSPARARAIAVTETTRAYAEGNKRAWERGGIVEKMTWRTSVDERVCKVCGPLHDQVVKLKEKFSSINGTLDGPPAHVNCRCWIVPEMVRDLTPQGELPVSETLTPGQQVREALRKLGEPPPGVNLQEMQATADRLTVDIRKLRTEGELLSERIGAATGEARAALMREYDMLGVTRARLLREKSAIMDQVNNILIPPKEAARRLLYVDNPTDLKVRIEGLSATASKKAVDAAAEFSKLVSKDAIDVWTIHVEGTKAGRAYAQGTDIFINNASSTRTIIHEMGHALEDASYTSRQSAKKFLARRTEGEKAQRLSDIYPDRGFDITEIAKPDAFESAYVGKIYRGGVTEVLSMGIETLWVDPIHFMESDPDFFDFIIGVLRGK